MTAAKPAPFTDAPADALIAEIDAILNDGISPDLARRIGVMGILQRARNRLAQQEERNADLVAERDEALEQARQNAEDAERLDWMQFHGAHVSWSRDSEVCTVKWYEGNHTRETTIFDDWRKAIDAARSGGSK